MSAVHDGTANVYQEVRQMSKTCDKCERCKGYDRDYGLFLCSIVGLVEYEQAMDESIECEFYADLRNDTTN